MSVCVLTVNMPGCPLPVVQPRDVDTGGGEGAGGGGGAGGVHLERHSSGWLAGGLSQD
eukprot:CAMPEP_0183792330 /NCGR_PEP_ID=MMETSP0803_2-20130417/2503_1 /TAXON_ID=195967 /ORGANISM="Crustomastix stigmata, Strain CCMP3273" /LENGTH=57 /DNA_ID=CAMNT_0026036683 /DNA_START=13 /DNA_END=186 /DNA_ORIENTATION=+